MTDGTPRGALLWRNPQNWSSFGYHCKEDPRVIVPKRNPAFGWTMNWSNPWAVPAMFGLTAVALLPMLVVVGIGKLGLFGAVGSVVAAFIAVPLTIWIVLGVCRRASRVT